jgi:hypothetical protein
MFRFVKEVHSQSGTVQIKEICFLNQGKWVAKVVTGVQENVEVIPEYQIA